MNKILKYIFPSLIFIINFVHSQTTFTRIASQKSGITFKNTIQESGIYNHIAWENVYHGAGVAVGDINNDGLPDLYFTGNQVEDKLYLNRSNFKFEDISDRVDFPADHYWSNGVSMVDINNDGYLDLYVCKSGFSLNPTDRRNLLFINNGDTTFSEQAQKYGLDDTGYSMQAAFIDYDRDGDLDVYIMNQPPSTQQEKMRDRISAQPCYDYTDRLLQNNLNTIGTFSDVTYLAEVQNCAYGLGISIVDLNEDGWDDIYIANDYFASDHLYINQKNGSFKDESKTYFRHTSLYAMGCDVADINNDGLLDLFTADMSAENHYRGKTNMPSMNVQRFKDIIASGFHHQYMFNTLQINTGQNNFSEVAQLAGLANTDWSWGVIWFDADNDRDLDLFISNGIKKEVRNVDALNKLRQQLADGTIKLSEILSITPSEKLKNYAFVNHGNLNFQKADWGVDELSFSNGCAYGDLDGDGDLDLVVSNVDDEPFIYRNQSRGNFLRIKLKGKKSNPFAYGSKVKLFFGDRTSYQILQPVKGYLSSSEPILHFGLGEFKAVNQVEVTWPNNVSQTVASVAANQVLEIVYQSAKIYTKPSQFTRRKILNTQSPPDFKHTEMPFEDFEKEILLPYKLSELGPALASADVNEDGLEDFYIGGGYGQAGKLYLQTETGFIPAPNQAWQNDTQFEEIGATFFDLNGDEYQDLYIASGSNQFESGSSSLKDRIFVGDGRGNFKPVDAFEDAPITSTKAVVPFDFDRDGDLDLFVGGRLEQQQYPRSPKSYLFENRAGRLVNVIATVAPDLENIGLVTDACYFENKKNRYLVVVGEWLPISIFKVGRKQISQQNFPALEKTRGLWFHVQAADFDQDGDIDLVAGNLGLNSKFKVDSEHGFHIFAHDFDNNGFMDIVLGKESNHKLVPVRGRECSSQQMPFIKTKFPTYTAFAKATLPDIYTEAGLNQSIHYEAETLSSLYLENVGGDYKLTELPWQAQVSPLLASVVQDLDSDGKPELITFGNLYETEVETTRLDASYGSVLKLVAGKWRAIRPEVSGLSVAGNTKSAVLIKGKARSYIAAGVNNAKVKMWQFSSK